MSHLFYRPEEIIKCIEAKVRIFDEDALIRTLLTDSRRLSDHVHALFFAINAQRNGHDYIAEVYRAGVRSFVISDLKYPVEKFPEANFYIVSDTLLALQQLAACHRSRFSYPVIGIAGSNGKTIVKEWLFQLLSPDCRIIRSPKSYNSQVGVPLSVWEMDDQHNLALFEAGISTADEMERLVKIIRPTVGILTNIGEAHQEGFSSRDAKIAEKLLLFRDSDLFIYPAKYLDPAKHAIPGKANFSWGMEHADLQILEINKCPDYTVITSLFLGQSFSFRIPFTDNASVENAISCLAYMLASGIGPAACVSRLEHLNPVGMRLELKKGKNNTSVIDDSYSLDLSSLAIALDFLDQQNQYPRRTIILSDIPGAKTQETYRSVNTMLTNRSVNRLIGVGPVLSSFADLFQMEKLFFSDTAALIASLPKLELGNETILLKGARAFHFESISKLLIQRVHGTVLEINLNALQYNLSYFRSLLPAGTRMMAMVKAFSYGSGSFEIANLLEFNKIDYLAVAYADEGVALRNAGISLPIMVMSPDEEALDSIIKYKLEPEIYNFRILNAFASLLASQNREEFPVHIKLDTGMHRLGFMEDEIEHLESLLGEQKQLKVVSVFSHLAGSSSADMDEFSRQQINLFNKISDRIEQRLGYPFLRHIANTSAIVRLPDARMDMVRLGIGLYGIDPSNDRKSPLQTVTSLKTSISQIKQLRAGETIGYDRAGTMPQDGQIATVKLGYADGYSRGFGMGNGFMTVNGKRAKTIGKICMDMCMLDITGIDAREGDEVIVFNGELRVEELAVLLKTIPYEILTGISDRVKRIYYYE